MSIFVISIVLTGHSATTIYQLPLSLSPLPTAPHFRAIHDVLLNHFPSALKDLTFYARAIDPKTIRDHFDFINTAIQQMDSTRTAFIEHGCNVTEIKKTKRLLNVILVDGAESSR